MKLALPLLTCVGAIRFEHCKCMVGSQTTKTILAPPRLTHFDSDVCVRDGLGPGVVVTNSTVVALWVGLELLLQPTHHHHYYIIVTVIIMHSFMRYFSKMEHIAHYKAKNQNSQNKLVQAHVCMHTLTHTLTDSQQDSLER